MEYVQFGHSGVRVTPLCLGCWNFGHVTEEAESVRIVREATDRGMNFVDTANVYTNGVSEDWIGKALAERGNRGDVFLATKVRSPMGDGPNDQGASRRHIMEHVDKSLSRLRTDWIDLYQIHWPDYDTPIDETLRALDDLIHAGKVRYIGTSNHAAWVGVEALWASERLRLNRFVSEQPPYNMLQRGAEREVLPFCAEYDYAVVPYSPLAGGWLSGRYLPGRTNTESGSRMSGSSDEFRTEAGRATLELVGRLAEIADDKAVSLGTFAVAWVLSHPAVTAPIIGPRTVEQLDDNLAALDVEITDEDRARVDEIVAPGENV